MFFLLDKYIFKTLSHKEPDFTQPDTLKIISAFLLLDSALGNCGAALTFRHILSLWKPWHKFCSYAESGTKLCWPFFLAGWNSLTCTPGNPSFMCKGKAHFRLTAEAEHRRQSGRFSVLITCLKLLHRILWAVLFFGRWLKSVKDW